MNVSDGAGTATCQGLLNACMLYQARPDTFQITCNVFCTVHRILRFDVRTSAERRGFSCTGEPITKHRAVSCNLGRFELEIPVAKSKELTEVILTDACAASPPFAKRTRSQF